ncbi:MAG: helicase Cas3 [Pelotomaculum sp. PtaB.Bin013]|uniref:CRISPR-associated helicase Cas3 n=1 Tax=Pelotomaculum isophthalicicum JI TaxID=947010 RepID=A0A9X4H3W4_9FIRM|nr:CRISPR-associated helicase Cas3' [Pelotomaculum isophthalicicum]MDF9407202.1 CRISPR-associated helicase Cas3' [Pelotomaculum isophthalicicum JI]OPX90846.1 MAG: helicase Cas3 [Pelotomaculum sp. PtaB.Bin013]
MHTKTNSFVAHIRQSDHAEQSVFKHNDNVASLASAVGERYGLGNLAKVAGRHHDDGKNTQEFDAYIRAAAAGEAVVRGSVIHSTHGAVLVDKLANQSDLYSKLTAEMIRTAIMSHHGLRDCLSTNGTIVFAEAAERILDSFNHVENYVSNHYSADFIKNEFLFACDDAKAIQTGINEFMRKNNAVGSAHFYLSMYMRLLTSILIDADRKNTACFEDAVDLPQALSCDECKPMWSDYIYQCEMRLAKMRSEKEPSDLDKFREEISQRCMEFDGGESGVFRLVVPCGAGKTLSSLRYALQTANRYAKKHVFYIAPFNSILEQNASEISNYIGDTDAVLEHHSNIVFGADDSEDEKKYELLIENWSKSPIIATTAVQFLNTLFAGKTSSVRRMQSLGDSVIILDEIQALPVKVLKLFNAAMNFLAYFCGASVVLCSATQPLLDKLDKYRILPPKSIIEDEEKYDAAFKRVEIVDCIKENGFSIDEAARFILEQAHDVKSMLAIVNTKSCARKIFEYIGNTIENAAEYCLFHLSTNMCPAHRGEVLEQMRRCLKRKDESKKIICVSTSLIEAGVDVSFERVIRSLTGLDSIVQAAGRCNRNRETDCGMVSIINIRDEHIGTLGHVKSAQEATRELLYNIKAHPEIYPGGALSKPAMDEYYARYFKPLLREMEYPLKYDPEHTLIDLLTINPSGYKRLKAQYGSSRSLLLKQAFKEAGEAFSVIDDDGKVDIIVEYNNDAQQWLQRLRSAATLQKKRSALRHLQRYTVQLRENKRKKIYSMLQINEAGVFVLPLACYDCKYGVDETRNIPVELFIV